MPVVVLLAVLVAAGLALVLRGKGDSDTPARIVAAATDRLPAQLRDWGRAMVAELAHVNGRARRWRFTAGILRVVLFAPLGHRNRALAVAFVGLIVAAAATVAAAREVPSLSVFAAVLGLLLCAYATVITSRPLRAYRTIPRALVATVALAGVAATITAVVRVAATHPTATSDHTHVFSVLFAFTLTGYLALALTPDHLGEHTNTVLCSALSAALASGAVWSIIALTTPVTTEGIAPFLEPVGAAATLAASIGASATTRSWPAGARAGLLTVILAAPMHFAVDMTALLHLHHYTLTNPYDIAAYPHSAYPDVASYVLSDAVAGNIIAGLVLYPITLLALALLGASAGTGLHQLAAKRTGRSTA
jgi:hypothetical protein